MSNLLIGVVMTILVLIVLGLIVGYSLLVERLAARRPKSAQEETPSAQETPPPPSLMDVLMSRLFGSAGPIASIATEQRSYAVERSAEPSGTAPSEPVPDLAEQLAVKRQLLLLPTIIKFAG